jgi:CYTH domain-containing protein
VSESNYGDFEFERKFYCREMPAVTALDPRPELILQAYLFAADGYAVRVRLQGPAPTEVNASLPELIETLGRVDADAIGTMTAKGPATGGTRYEAERELDPTVAGQIVSRAAHVVIKVRYSAWLGEDGWIVDRFLGRNAPLLLAEVERNAPVVDLTIPEFCATEVSEDDRFRNEYLAHQPFGEWADEYRDELQKVGPRFVETLGRNEVEGSQPRP